MVANEPPPAGPRDQHPHPVIPRRPRHKPAQRQGGPARPWYRADGANSDPPAGVQSVSSGGAHGVAMTSHMTAELARIHRADLVSQADRSRLVAQARTPRTLAWAPSLRRRPRATRVVCAPSA